MRAKGYEYITDNQSNTILAVSKATGECVEAETILIPKGSWVVTPEQKEINRERKRQKQQDILESKKRGRTKEAYTFVSTTETFKVDRLHKAFKNLSFDVGNNRRELFCSIIKNEYTDKQLMIINPKIFYSGSNPNAVLEYGVFY